MDRNENEKEKEREGEAKNFILKILECVVRALHGVRYIWCRVYVRHTGPAYSLFISLSLVGCACGDCCRCVCRSAIHLKWKTY